MVRERSVSEMSWRQRMTFNRSHGLTILAGSERDSSDRLMSVGNGSGRQARRGDRVYGEHAKPGEERSGKRGLTHKYIIR